MVFKIKFSKKTEKIFSEIEASERLPPYITSKLALALALKTHTPVSSKEVNTDNLGKDINIQQVTGEFDMLFKSLISLNEGRYINYDEYSQIFLKAYLDRGAHLLYQEFKYGGDFISHLLELDKAI